MRGFRGNWARALGALAAALLSASCGILTPDEWREALEANRARWSQEGIRDYSIELHRTSSEFGSRIEVVVRADTVESATVLWTFPDPPFSPPVARTVDQLFDDVAALIDERPADLDVEYDATFGSPTQVSVDLREDFVDDEYGFGMSDLVPLVEGG